MIEAPAPPGRRGVTGRVIRPRRGLPNGRAVVGGFLIALAAVGTFAAYTSATAVPATRYAVAARDLVPGDRIGVGDLRLVAVALPDDQRRRSFDVLEPLVGTTVVEPLLSGELVQEGSLVRTSADAGTRTVSFAVDPARALAGRLEPGERVDVVATFGSGSEACTALVAADVPLVAVGQTTGALGAAGATTASVAVADAEQEVAVAHAANAGTVTLVRTTGAAPASIPPRLCTPGRGEVEDAGGDR